MAQDRRRLPRLPFNVQVECNLADQPGDGITAQSRNISCGGICVVLLEKHDVGAAVELRLAMPNSGTRLTIHGRVARSEEYTIADEKSYDTGIEFVDLNEDSRMTFDRFIHGDN